MPIPILDVRGCLGAGLVTYPIERRAWLLDGGGVGLERSPYMKLKPSFFPTAVADGVRYCGLGCV